MSEAISKTKQLNEVINIFQGSFEPEFDGKIRRFSPNGKRSKSGWTVGWKLGDLEVLLAGDFATMGEDYHQYINKLRLDKGARDEYKLKLEQIYAERRKQELEYHIERREIASTIPASMVSYAPDQFEYFKGKSIDGLYGGFFVKDENAERPYFVVPMQDAGGVVWNYQRIFSDGTKLFMKGRAKELFHTIGSTTDTWLLCEGFATGVSLHRATGLHVVVCFSAYNMVSVAGVFKNCKNRIIACADNDKFNKANAGLDAAKEINRKFHFEITYPKFTDETNHPTDFNDLHLLSGLDFVRNWILGESGGEEYLTFKSVFEKARFFSEVKKELLTGVVYHEDIKGINPLLNMDGEIKSVCSDYKLDSSKVMNHLDRWLRGLPGRLIIDVPEWDGVDRIAEQFSYVKVTNINQAFAEDLFKAWCAGLWNRFLNCKYQNWILLLLGKPGLGKDLFIDNLFSGFGPYYTQVSAHSHENDICIAMSKHIVINIPEFEQLDKKGVAFIKDVSTTPFKEIRAAYARMAKRYEMHASIIGSSNRMDILRDETGNRRFALFEVDDISWNYPILSDSEKIQIVAQCKYLSENKFKADQASIEMMKAKVEEMTPDDPIAMALCAFKEMMVKKFNEIEVKNNQDKDPNRITNADVQKDIFEISKNHGIRPSNLQSAIKREKLQKKVRGNYFFNKSDFIIETMN